jgi:hypothetical protein
VEKLGHPVRPVMTHYGKSNCARIAKNIIRRVSV